MHDRSLPWAYGLTSCVFWSAQVMKCQEYGESSDIWSLGLCCHMLVTGMIPWQGEGVQEIQQVKKATALVHDPCVIPCIHLHVTLGCTSVVSSDHPPPLLCNHHTTPHHTMPASVPVYPCEPILSQPAWLRTCASAPQCASVSACQRAGITVHVTGLTACWWCGCLCCWRCVMCSCSCSWLCTVDFARGGEPSSV